MSSNFLIKLKKQMRLKKKKKLDLFRAYCPKYSSRIFIRQWMLTLLVIFKRN